MKKQNRYWLAIASAFGVNGLFFGGWASRIPAVADRFDMSHAQLGGFLLLLSLGAMLFFPTTGALVSRFGARPVTLISYGALAVALTLLGLAPSLPLLAVALFLFGAAIGAMDVSMNAWGSEVEQKFGKIWMPSFHAIWSMGAGFGAVTGFVALSLNASYGQHFFLIAALPMAFVYLGMKVKWRARPKQAPKRGPAFMIPKGAVFFAGIFALCAGLGEGVIADWSAIYLIEVLSSEERLAPMGIAVFSVAMVLMRLMGGVLIKRLGLEKAALYSGIAALAGASCVVFLGTTLGAMVGFVLLGFGYASGFPIAVLRAGQDPDMPPAQAIAGVATLGYGGTLLGPPLIGFLTTATDLRTAFGLLILLAILAISVSSKVGLPRSAETKMA